MAKIYRTPDEIKRPSFEGDWEANEQKYLKEVKDFCLNRKKGKNVGEIIKFPACDGYAEYMVASMRPLELIHLEHMDAYTFQYVHLLTAKEVNEQIDNQKRLAEMLDKHRVNKK